MTINLQRFAQWQLSSCCPSQMDLNIPKEIIDLLTASWEWKGEAEDARGNQDFQYNPLFWSGRYLEPVINLWLKNQGDHLDSSGGLLWPHGNRFAVCLSHDVDSVTYDSFLPRLRHAKRLLSICLKNKEMAKTWVSALYFKATKVVGFSETGGGKGVVKAQNADLFGPWLALEARYGFRSTFFFFPEETSRYHVFDGPLYRYGDRIFFEEQRLTVSELMRDLDRRGWEIGLHGTYNSFDNAEELKKQKDQIERVLQKEIVSTRQHYLHFDTCQTPKAQAQAGFKFDSTFGSNRIIGFRNGMAFPFYFYDLKADRPISLLEIPLHIQDVALLSPQHLDLNPFDALARAKELIDRVEATQGLISLLWHPNSAHEARYPGWFWVYEELLNYISRKNAWVAPVGTIGQWWEQRMRNNNIFSLGDLQKTHRLDSANQ